MDKQETIKILAILEIAYSNFPEITDERIALWQEMFPESYSLVAEAVKAWIASDSSNFPPSIGQIRNKMHFLIAKPEVTEQEAWKLINRAIYQVNPYDNKKTRQAYEDLPELLRKMTSPSELLTWAYMDASDVDTVVKSNFMRSYRAKAKYQKEYDALPDSAKKLSKQLIGTVVKELT